MSFSKSVLILVLSVSAVGLAFAANTPPVAADAKSTPILPQGFAGWQVQGTAQTSADARIADPANAAILKEFGFSDFASATYRRDDGRTLKVRAARFADASGAFGAYTFYLQPNMSKEQIGDQAASLNSRVLFYRGHVLVDAAFSSLSAMSAAELRELAGVLPRPSGNAANLPPILAFMPHRGYVANTEKYALGPLAFVALSSPITAQLVDFTASAEVAMGKYASPGGQASLVLIEYPTPQLAAEHLRRIDAVRQAGSPQAGVAAIENVGPFFDKRTGPIIAIAAGPLSESDAHALLGLVNYEANVTWNENTYLDKNNNVGTLLVNVIILCFVLGAIAIVAGVGFGGIRILVKRFFPNKVFDRPEHMEFISLHLAEKMAEGSSGGSSDAVAETAETPRSLG
ncbi:MAG: hypothetical protein DMG76_12555 [Acidobacteria bacterium]|nr:MAG: hypothetical protein DMG76_12555 [Acidobacteriota bacterium]